MCHEPPSGDRASPNGVGRVRTREDRDRSAEGQIAGVFCLKRLLTSAIQKKVSK